MLCSVVVSSFNKAAFIGAAVASNLSGLAVDRLSRFLEERSFDAAGVAVTAFYGRLLAR